MLKIENITNTYSISNYPEFGLIDADHKHLLYRQFLTFHCKVGSIAPYIEYVQKPYNSGIAKWKREWGIVTLYSISLLKDAAAKKKKKERKEIKSFCTLNRRIYLHADR